MGLPLPFTEEYPGRIRVEGPAASACAISLVSHWEGLGLRIGVVAPTPFPARHTRVARGCDAVMRAVDELDERALDGLVTLGHDLTRAEGAGPEILEDDARRLRSWLQRYHEGCAIPWVTVGDWPPGPGLRLRAHQVDEAIGVVRHDAPGGIREVRLRVGQGLWTTEVVTGCPFHGTGHGGPALHELLHARRARAEQAR